MDVEYKIEKGAFLRGRTHDAIMFCIDVLLLSEVPGRLTVIIFNPVEGQDHQADCIFDGIDDYEVRFWNQELETVMHEMVHVMQSANYELELYGEGHGYWQGKVVKGLTYETSPWEIEATKLESILVKNFLTLNAQPCIISTLNETTTNKFREKIYDSNDSKSKW